jgi:hypothetical protein
VLAAFAVRGWQNPNRAEDPVWRSDGRAATVLYQPRTWVPVYDALVPATVKQRRSPDIKVIQRNPFTSPAIPDGRIIGLKPLLTVWALSAKVLAQLIGAV